MAVVDKAEGTERHGFLGLSFCASLLLNTAKHSRVEKALCLYSQVEIWTAEIEKQ